MNNHISCFLQLIRVLIFVFSVLISWSASAANNKLSGEVKVMITVTRPTCNISTEDQSIKVHFGNVSYKDLLNNAEPNEGFILHLTRCNINVVNSVAFVFKGTEEKTMPGLLALNKSSVASGFAIGILDESGKKIEINHRSSLYSLHDGDNDFKFNAYLKAIPGAQKNKRLREGAFESQSVLELIYE